MTTPFHFPVTASQVGTYFVGQYYQMLQHQPHHVHQFYGDASTLIRIDGNSRETATAMMQIHSLVMSLNYSGIEIKTAHSLESWNGGVLVMVSGSVHLNDFNRRRKFMQTFFLAPQEKGFFVLNDIFHFVEHEQIHQHPMSYLAQSNFNPKLNAPNIIRDQVSHYTLDGDIEARKYLATSKNEENGPVDSYGFTEVSEEQLKKVPEAESILDNNFGGVESNGSLKNTVDAVQHHLSAPIEEPVGEPQKHTYASILAKGYSAPAVPPSSNTGLAPQEWQHITESQSLPSFVSSSNAERSEMEAVEEPSAIEDNVEVKSVYVRNVPTTMAASEIEEEFKKFGKLSSDGVAIRTRKDIDTCYAFVEFEDITGVQNAIKASSVEIAGHQLYIEGRRPNRNNSYRGRARGRSRFSYQTEGSRGQFGSRGYVRGSGLDGDARDYNRPRGNGIYRQGPRQDRPYYANQQGSRNGLQNASE